MEVAECAESLIKGEVDEKPPSINTKTYNFKKQFYSDISLREWNDWKWQFKNRITTLEKLKRITRLSHNEESAFLNSKYILPFAVTPYYMSLIYDNKLRSTMIPTCNEFIQGNNESDDPLSEDLTSPCEGIVHRYPDRALFLTTGICSSYCRFCTRSRAVGNHQTINIANWDESINYIRKTPQIRDVILSGGDPLTLSNEHLEYLLKSLRNIPHIEIIRIGTKIPVVLPQRITPTLVKMISKYHPVYMSVHFTHPDECTIENKNACDMLANAGIVLGSQTVLLKGINNDIETMKSLMHKLLIRRVRPYYIYQCDPITGSAHFRTKVQDGIDIIKGLRGHTSGYAIPSFVIDAPGGGGKIPINPDFFNYSNNKVEMTNFQNKNFVYQEI
ncbi:MAG: KamA family radical SAM protein [Candidatus Paceibacterota bacterium]|jgi:lysine 2,3-aminomutase